MRSLAIFSEAGAQLISDNPTLSRISIKGIGVHAALVSTPRTRLDAKDASNDTKVLVRVRAFSCNYRDLRIILDKATAATPSAVAVGSDFSGDVVRVGAKVSGLKPGDRVIPNSVYHVVADEAGRVHYGIPTNLGSCEYLLLDQEQLIVIPDCMSYVHGAAFTIGGQTSYAMVRRLDPRPSDSVLVTAGRSSTSLFCIAALRARGIRTFVLTSSAKDHGRFADLGVEAAFVVDPNRESLTGEGALAETAYKLGGFSHVIDPYFDLYLSRVLPLLARHGSYISCGMYEQDFVSLGIAKPAVMTNFTQAMFTGLLRNQTIHLN